MVVTGIDVSKALWDVAMAEGPVYRFANSGPLQHRDCAEATQVVCGATGWYERLLVSRLGVTGIIVWRPIRYRCAPVATRPGRPPGCRVLARDGLVFLALNPCPSETEAECEELPQRLRRHRPRVYSESSRLRKNAAG